MQAKDGSGGVDGLVRQRLRELRSQRGLTLRQVSERANIDVSTLSRLESGKRRLALDHLSALASALDVTTDRLLGSESQNDPRVRRGPRMEDGMTIWPLNRASREGASKAFKIVIAGDRREPPAELPVHDGEDWIYVLSGRLRMILGDQHYVIEPGEAAEFTTWTPHWFGALDGPVELLMIVGAHGERHHLHERHQRNQQQHGISATAVARHAQGQPTDAPARATRGS